jgi:hypothetical protein
MNYGSKLFFFYMVMILLQRLYGSLEAADRIRVS